MRYGSWLFAGATGKNVVAKINASTNLLKIFLGVAIKEASN